MITDDDIRKVARRPALAMACGIGDPEYDEPLIEVCAELLQMRAERVAWESTGDAALGDLAEIEVERDALREELDSVVEACVEEYGDGTNSDHHFWCLLCDERGATAQTIPHEPDCPLAKEGTDDL